MKNKIFILASLLGMVFFAILTVNAQKIPPGQYEGDDCTLTVFGDGSMLEMCDNGTGTIYSKSTPIGGCAEAYDGCKGYIIFQ